MPPKQDPSKIAAKNASPSKSSNTNEADNTIQSIFKGLEDSTLIQAFIKGIDKYDSIRTYVDQRFNHFDREIYDLRDQVRTLNTRAETAEKRAESLENETKC